MIRALQINVGVCRVAQDLAIATANEVDADVLIISEPHRDRGEDCSWYADVNNRAAIAIVSGISIDKIGPPLMGFRWLEIKGYRLYRCYISPNVSYADFEVFLTGLKMSVKSATSLVIIAGDFNSKFPEWGSPFEDRRGRALADLLNAPRGQHKAKAKKGWAYSKLDCSKLNEKLRRGPPVAPDEIVSACKQAITWLSDACDS